MMEQIGTLSLPSSPTKGQSTIRLQRRWQQDLFRRAACSARRQCSGMTVWHLPPHLTTRICTELISLPTSRSICGVHHGLGIQIFGCGYLTRQELKSRSSTHRGTTFCSTASSYRPLELTTSVSAIRLTMPTIRRPEAVIQACLAVFTTSTFNSFNLRVSPSPTDSNPESLTAPAGTFSVTISDMDRALRVSNRPHPPRWLDLIALS